MIKCNIKLFELCVTFLIAYSLLNKNNQFVYNLWLFDSIKKSQKLLEMSYLSFQIELKQIIMYFFLKPTFFRATFQWNIMYHVMDIEISYEGARIPNSEAVSKPTASRIIT